MSVVLYFWCRLSVFFYSFLYIFKDLPLSHKSDQFFENPSFFLAVSRPFRGLPTSLILNDSSISCTLPLGLINYDNCLGVAVDIICITVLAQGFGWSWRIFLLFLVLHLYLVTFDVSWFVTFLAWANFRLLLCCHTLCMAFIWSSMFLSCFLSLFNLPW